MGSARLCEILTLSCGKHRSSHKRKCRQRTDLPHLELLLDRSNGQRGPLPRVPCADRCRAARAKSVAAQNRRPGLCVQAAVGSSAHCEQPTRDIQLERVRAMALLCPVGSDDKRAATDAAARETPMKFLWFHLMPYKELP